MPEARIGSDTALTEIDPVECLIGKPGAATGSINQPQRMQHILRRACIKARADPGLQNGMKRPGQMPKSDRRSQRDRDPSTVSI